MISNTTKKEWSTPKAEWYDIDQTKGGRTTYLLERTGYLS